MKLFNLQTKIYSTFGIAFFINAVILKWVYYHEMLKVPIGYRQYYFKSFAPIYNLGWFICGIAAALFMIVIINVFCEYIQNNVRRKHGRKKSKIRVR